MRHKRGIIITEAQGDFVAVDARENIRSVLKKLIEAGLVEDE